MHRNTKVFIAVLAALAIFLAFVRTHPPADPLSRMTPVTLPPTPTVVRPATIDYVSDYCGIAVTRPLSVSVKELSSGSAVFTTKESSTASVLACEKQIPRPALVQSKIETVAIGSVSAKLYHDASSKDGTPVDILMFRHPDTGMDVLFSGFGPVYRAMLSTLTIR